MNPLEASLRPLARILNRNIAETTPAREACASLDGTVAAIRVRGTALTMFFRIHQDRIELGTAAVDDPDIVISGSLGALARAAAGNSEDAIRDGSLELIGDAEKAQAFQQLLAHARPDAEEELASLVGDPAAHSLGRAARRVSRWARDARATMAANVGEYLQEESRDVPARAEVERFASKLSVLRDDVERLAARIDRLQDER